MRPEHRYSAKAVKEAKANVNDVIGTGLPSVRSEVVRSGGC